MIAPPDLSAAEISRRLTTARFGRVLHVYDVAASTNDLAKGLAEAGAAEGTAVVAREQLAGRGRYGHRWVSPRGGLWISVVFRPPLPVDEWPLLGFILALAACRAIDASTGLRTGVKWPNDVMMHSRKLGGVLVEGAPAFAVGGVGINANIPADAFDPAIGDTATSLQALTGRAVDLNGLAAGLLLSIEQSYARLRSERTWVLDEWRRRAVALGGLVHVIGATSFDGIVEDIDDFGALRVRTPDGIRIVRAGEVSLRPAEPSGE